MVQPLRPHEVIAESVVKLRKRLGWSAERLAEEMKKVGVPWERMVVTKLENRKRANVSVEELLALAYVLDVNPVHLLVPPDSNVDEDRYAITPADPPEGYRLTPDMARAWIRGEAAAGRQDPRLVAAYQPLHDWHAGQGMPFHPAKDDDGQR